MALLTRDTRRLVDPTSWPDCCARCGAAGATPLAMPSRYAKKIEGITIPFCPAHADDWEVTRRRSKVGGFLILAGMALTAVTVWEVQPVVAAPANQNGNSRFMATLMLGLVSAIPFGMVGLWWAKTPVRVQETQGRNVILAGVCRAFAKAAKEVDEPAPIPVVEGAVRFDVAAYRPRGGSPPGAVPRLLVVTLVAAGLLGCVIGFGGREFGQYTAGWPANDWRFLGLLVAVAAAYLLPQFGPLLASRFGLICFGLLIAGITVLATLARAVGIAKFEQSYSFVFCLGALLLLAVSVTARLCWRWRVRTPVVAASVGGLGPLVLTGVAWLIAGHDPGPHRMMPVLGIVAALISSLWNLQHARTPFCLDCDGWLVGRRIGGFPRPLDEIRPILSSGGFVSLAGAEPYAARTTIGDVEVKVHSCPECKEQGTVVVELFDCVGGGKNRKAPTLVAAGRWHYPGSALAVIDRIFPPPDKGSTGP